MNFFKRYLLPALIWLSVAAYIAVAARITHARLAESVVGSVDIDIVDSTADRRLVTNAMVREWIHKSGISTIGVPLRDVNCSDIEDLITRNGFVSKAVVYTASNGRLYIKVGQRQPALRLLTAGYDRYCTERGFIFGTPAASTVYVPVLTGGYVPPFPANYEGRARTYTDSIIYGHKGIAAHIAELQKERIALRKSVAAKYKEIDEQPKIYKFKRHLLESADIRAKRKEALDKQKKEAVAALESEIRTLYRKIDDTDRYISDQRAQIKKAEKKYEDFVKLINFVRKIEEDSFWRSEIVQITVDTTPAGAMNIALVPRSGSFVIEFGELENVDSKLDKLLRFYREGLKNIGWDLYATVNVAYDNQVVCRK